MYGEKIEWEEENEKIIRHISDYDEPVPCGMRFQKQRNKP